MNSDRPSILAALSRSRLFANLGRDDLEKLAASPRLMLRKGEELFAAGAPAKAVYLVLSGEVTLEIADIDGKTISVAAHGPGGVFGELAVLDGKPRSVAARASADSALLSISAAGFLNLVRSSPDFAMTIIRDLAGKVRATNSKVSDLSFQTLLARVAGLLADLADAEGADLPTLRITQSEIANRLGASREKVNGHLQAIQDEGAIRLARGRIEIRSRAILHRLRGEPAS